MGLCVTHELSGIVALAASIGFAIPDQTLFEGERVNETHHAVCAKSNFCSGVERRV